MNIFNDVNKEPQLYRGLGIPSSQEIILVHASAELTKIRCAYFFETPRESPETHHAPDTKVADS